MHWVHWLRDAWSYIYFILCFFFKQDIFLSHLQDTQTCTRCFANYPPHRGGREGVVPPAKISSVMLATGAQWWHYRSFDCQCPALKVIDINRPPPRKGEQWSSRESLGGTTVPLISLLSSIECQGWNLASLKKRSAATTIGFQWRHHCLFDFC